MDIPLYFISSDIVVLPYLYFASQSGVLSQAYTYERSVVVTDVRGWLDTTEGFFYTFENFLLFRKKMKCSWLFLEKAKRGN